MCGDFSKIIISLADNSKEMNHPQSTSESRVQFSEIVIIGSRWFIVELARTLEHIVKSDRFWQSRSMSDACEPRAYARNPHLLAAHTLCWPKKTVHVPPARHEIVPARAHAASIGHVTTSILRVVLFPDLLRSSLSYTQSLIRLCTSLPSRVLNFVTPEFYTPLSLESIARDARYQEAQ